MNMAKRLTLAFTVNFVMLHVAMGINVGVGISDITGPAAEVPMVSLINCKFYEWLDSSMNVCSNTYTPNGHFMTLYTYTKQRVFHIDLLISQSASCENNWSKGFINIELAQYVRLQCTHKVVSKF